MCEEEIFFRLHYESYDVDMIVASIPENCKLPEIVEALSKPAMCIPVSYPGLPRIINNWFNFYTGEIVPLSKFVQDKIDKAIDNLPVQAQRSYYEEICEKALSKNFTIAGLSKAMLEDEGLAEDRLKNYVFSVLDIALGHKNPPRTITEREAKDALDEGLILPEDIFGTVCVIERENAQALTLCFRGGNNPYSVIYIPDTTAMDTRNAQESRNAFQELYDRAYYCKEDELHAILDRERTYFDIDDTLFDKFKKAVEDHLTREVEF